MPQLHAAPTLLSLLWFQPRSGDKESLVLSILAPMAVSYPRDECPSLLEEEVFFPPHLRFGSPSTDGVKEMSDSRT